MISSRLFIFNIWKRRFSQDGRSKIAGTIDRSVTLWHKTLCKNLGSIFR
jgi:hypothetical protein